VLLPVLVWQESFMKELPGTICALVAAITMAGVNSESTQLNDDCPSSTPPHQCSPDFYRL
jgi:hypothetical protein